MGVEGENQVKKRNEVYTTCGRSLTKSRTKSEYSKLSLSCELEYAMGGGSLM